MAVCYRRAENLELLLNYIIEITPEQLVVFLSTPGTIHGTPLMTAVDISDIHILTKLIEADKSVESMGEKETAEAQGISLEAFTDALCHSIRKQFNQRGLALIESMRNISRHSSSGETPLHTVVQAGNEKMGITLLERGAQVNAKHRKTRETLYTVATLANLTSIKKILCKHEIEYCPRTSSQQRKLEMR